MQNAFSIFYAVFFGAILSAEIGSHVFRLDPTGSAPRAKTRGGYILRVLLLGVARIVYFAVAYPTLKPNLDSTYWKAAIQLFFAVLLCLPVFTFQQILYAVRPDANPEEITTSRKSAWFFTLLSGVTVIVILVLV